MVNRGEGALIDLKGISVQCRNLLIAVLRIRIRMDPELLPGYGFGVIVPDPDPVKMKKRAHNFPGQLFYDGQCEFLRKKTKYLNYTVLAICKTKKLFNKK